MLESFFFLKRDTNFSLISTFIKTVSSEYIAARQVQLEVFWLNNWILHCSGLKTNK